ncbi:nickel pincer cofactor biosynthesis protein LarC [Bacteroidota bacterium]
MNIIYYDCFAGISGDMNLAAMIDLGVDKNYIINELKKIDLDGYKIEVKKEKRNGIEGSRVDVILKDNDKPEHRNLEIIENLINRSNLNDNVKSLAIKVFRILGEAEAHVHGKNIDEIHFHEVGAIDSIVDIVGAAICLDYLKVDKVICSTIELGGGFVKCAHGILPVPAPATVQILNGIPTKKGAVDKETTTPTGAAILTAFADEFSDKTDFTIIKTAYGVGHREMEIPNLLRVFLAEKKENTNKESFEDCSAIVVESNIDDMNPEIYDYVFEKLFDAGAMDVFLTPIIMKKGRPANKLSVLCNEKTSKQICEIILTETTSLGVRKYEVHKTFLDRKYSELKTKYGQVTIKYSYVGDKLIGFKPEYEDCKKLATKNNIPIKDIYNVVNKLINTNKNEC